MLVIHPDECIDRGVCEPECPAEAIFPDSVPGLEKWLKLNADYVPKWPNITIKREPPADAKEFDGKTNKFEAYFSPESGQGTRRDSPRLTARYGACSKAARSVNRTAISSWHATIRRRRTRSRERLISSSSKPVRRSLQGGRHTEEGDLSMKRSIVAAALSVVCVSSAAYATATPWPAKPCSTNARSAIGPPRGRTALAQRCSGLSAATPPAWRASLFRCDEGRQQDMGRGDARRLSYDPKALVPGTKMTFAGLKAEDRANVIAFLATLK